MVFYKEFVTGSADRQHCSSVCGRLCHCQCNGEVCYVTRLGGRKLCVWLTDMYTVFCCSTFSVIFSTLRLQSQSASRPVWVAVVSICVVNVYLFLRAFRRVSCRNSDAEVCCIMYGNEMLSALYWNVLLSMQVFILHAFITAMSTRVSILSKVNQNGRHIILLCPRPCRGGGGIKRSSASVCPSVCLMSRTSALTR